MAKKRQKRVLFPWNHLLVFLYPVNLYVDLFGVGREKLRESP